MVYSRTPVPETANPRICVAASSQSATCLQKRNICVGTHYCLAVGNDKGLELDETDEDEELCESDEEEVE